jgi:hypothetical protein
VDGKAKAEAVFTGSIPGPAPKVPESNFGKPHDAIAPKDAESIFGAIQENGGKMK